MKKKLWGIFFVFLFFFAACSNRNTSISNETNSISPSSVFSSGDTPTNSPPKIVVPGDYEEFSGPFPSWLNVKDFGAKGDGVTDDTLALQKALDHMGSFIGKIPISACLGLNGKPYWIPLSPNHFKH